MMPGQFTAQCCCCKVSWLVFQKWRVCMGWLCYPFTSQTIPVHKKPASLLPEYAVFDWAIANLHIRSEHCMGALKGRFQCPHGLQVTINNKQQHIAAFQWMTIAIISTQYCWSGGDTCRLFCIWSYSSLGTGGSWCAGWGRLDSGRGLWSRWRSKKEEAYRRVIGIQKLIIQLYWSWLPMDQIQMNDNKWVTMVSVRNDLTVTVDDVVQIKGLPNHPASQGRTDQLTLGDECHHCQED